MTFMVSPYRFSAEGTDVVIAVQDFSVPTDTAVDHDYTSAAFGGDTLKAALIISSGYDTADGSSQTADGHVSIGSIADGNAAIAAVTRASFDTRRRIFNTDAFALCRADNAAPRWRASGSLIADGIRLNGISASGTTTRVAAFVGFSGADVQSKNGAIALGTGTSAISVSCGFQPDIVFLFGAQVATSSSTTLGEFSYSFGIATDDGAQRTVIHAMDTIGTPLQALLTNRGGGRITASSGAKTFDLTVGGFTSSGFEVTPSASASSINIGYLALKIGGKRAKIVDFTTPTSTGSSAITGAGFTPQFAIVVLTNLEATDPSFSISTSDNMGSMSISLIGDEQWATGYCQDSGTVNSASQRRNTALMGGSSTDADAIIASLTSFDSDGMTLNYSAVQGTGKKGFILFIE